MCPATDAINSRHVLTWSLFRRIGPRHTVQNLDPVQIYLLTVNVKPVVSRRGHGPASAHSSDG